MLILLFYSFFVITFRYNLVAVIVIFACDCLFWVYVMDQVDQSFEWRKFFCSIKMWHWVWEKNWRDLIIFYVGTDTVLRVLHEIRRLLNRIQPYYKNDRQRKRCKRHFADVSVNPATIISASFAIANAFIEYPDDRGEVPLRHSLMLHVVPFPVKPALQSHLCENCRGKTCYFTYMLECARMEK